MELWLLAARQLLHLLPWLLPEPTTVSAVSLEYFRTIVSGVDRDVNLIQPDSNGMVEQRVSEASVTGGPRL